MLGANTSTLPTLKTDLSDNPFIKYYIFEATVYFPPRDNTIGIVDQYCEHHNMYFISHSTNNSPCNSDFTVRNSTNLCIIIIGRKEPTKFQQVLDALSNQQLSGK